MSVWSSFRTGVLKKMTPFPIVNFVSQSAASEGIAVTRNLAAQPLVRFWILDASLAGLDPRELITIQSLPDLADWERFEATRKALGPNLTQAFRRSVWTIQG